MKRLILTLLVFICPSILLAQSIQKGKIVLQNSGGTPVEGVSIRADGALPTISDQNGTFLLSFSTLKAGDRIICEEIYKKNYEVVNEKDIQQWFLSEKEDFIIVLCHQGTLNESRDRYYEVGKQTLQQNFESLKKQYNLLLNDHKISQQEYQKRLSNAYDALHTALDKLNFFSEKLAHINKDDMDSIGLAALQLFEQGNINGAIALYQETNSLERLKEKTQLRDETIEDINNLITILKEENDYRMLAGGASNYQRIETNWEEIIAADNTNYENLKEYGAFLYETRQYAKVVATYQQAEKSTNDIFQKISIFNDLSDVYREMQDFENAKDVLQKALTLENLISDKSTDSYLRNYVSTLTKFGLLYNILNEMELANEYFSEALPLAKRLAEDQTEINLVNYAHTLNYASVFFQNNNYYSQSIEYFLEEIKIYEQLTIQYPKKYDHYLALAYSNLGGIYYFIKDGEQSIKYHLLAYELCKKNAADSIGSLLETQAFAASNLGMAYQLTYQYDASEKYTLEALSLLEYLAKDNPIVYNVSLFYVNTTLGELFSKTSEYEKSIFYFQKSIALSEELVQVNKSVNLNLLASAYCRLGIVYMQTGDFQKADSLFAQSSDLYKQCIKTQHNLKREYASFLDHYGDLYQYMDQFELSKKTRLEGLAIRKKLMKEDQDAYAGEYASSLNNLGYFYGSYQNFGKAVKYMEDATAIMEELAVKHPDQYNSYVAGNYNNLGFLSWKGGKYEKSETYYLKSVNLVETMKTSNPESAELLDPILAQYTKNLAIMYFDWKHFDKAKHYFNESLPIYKKILNNNPEKFQPEIDKIEGYLKSMI